MKIILVIFRKEILETLRDRRTLLTMIIIPFLLLPVVFSVLSSLQMSQRENARMQTLRIAIAGEENARELVQRIERRRDVQVRRLTDCSSCRTLIRTDSLDLALEIDADFDANIAAGKTGELQIYYDSTDDTLIYSTLHQTIMDYHEAVLDRRLLTLEIDRPMITPTSIVNKDVLSRSESLGKMIGGLLPYVFVLFCLVGAMYPAIDLFTGEKERGTIETILSVPVQRLQILLGKMMVVVLGGVLSGLLTILGMYLALKINPGIPSFMREIVLSILSPGAIALVILMLIPLNVFFAGILIPASIYARSFKEAQSLIQPLIFVLIVPLIAATSPGIQLNKVTALLPVLNVALASREIVAGTIDYGLLALVFGSLISFAALAIIICVRWFGKEGNILRV